ncbi:MAG: tetratricopeptide repeat protein [Bacteroidia bacterium]|nr:tetratricopeptide repeat protein [Bacteroidia bacterium]
MLRKYCLYLLLILLSFGEGYGKDKCKIDSLRAAYQTVTHDTAKIIILLAWGEEINVNKLDSTIILYHKAVELAKKNLSENLNGKTILSLATGQAGDELVKVFKKLLANAYYKIADRYYNQGKIDKALEYYFLSLKISEELKEKQGMAYCYNSIALTYEYQGELDKALEYYFLSLKIREEFKDTEGMAHEYWNIASFYHIKKDYANCIAYYTEAAASYFELNNSYGTASGFYTKATLFEIENKIDSAIYSYEQALSYYKEIDHVQYVGWCYREISNCFSLKNDLIKTIEYAESSLSLAKELGIVGDINYAARFLSSHYKEQNNFEDALIMYELEIEMQDSIVNKETQKATIRQQMKYEYEKEELVKEQEEKEQLRLAAEDQSRRDDLHYAGIFIGMFLLFGVVLMLGFVKVPPKGAEVIIFLSFLILFEFLLVLLDPFVEEYTGGAPIFKLLLNAVLAGLIFPLHQFFEKKLKKKLIKGKRNSPPFLGGVGGGKEVKALMFLGLVIVNPYLFAQTDTVTKSPPVGGDLEGVSKIDSLKAELTTSTHDTTKVNILTEIGELDMIFRISYWDTIIQICNKNLPNKNSLEEIVFLHTKADALNNVGYIYQHQGDIKKGLEYYFESMKIEEEFFLEKSRKKWTESLGDLTFLKSKKMFKKGLASTYNNIGAIYDDQGEIEKALEYYFLSLKIREEINDKIGMAISYNNIGAFLCERDSLEEGMRYLEMGLALNEQLGNKAGVSYSNSSIGGWQLKIGYVKAALESGLEALSVANEIGYVDYIQSASKLLSDVYKMQGKFKDALAMYELEIQMRDSMVNEENQKATIRQQMKYEYEKAQILKEQQEIEQARIQAEITSRRDNLQHSAIFIGILILFGGVLMLGFVKVRPKDVEAIIFISFLILFEFVLVLADPHIEQYTGGAPGYKLIFNAGIAGLMFPLHQFFGGKLKKRIVKVQRKKIREQIEQYKKDTEGM